MGSPSVEHDEHGREAHTRGGSRYAVARGTPSTGPTTLAGRGGVPKAGSAHRLHVGSSVLEVTPCAPLRQTSRPSPSHGPGFWHGSSPGRRARPRAPLDGRWVLATSMPRWTSASGSLIGT